MKQERLAREVNGQTERKEMRQATLQLFRPSLQVQLLRYANYFRSSSICVTAFANLFIVPMNTPTLFKHILYEMRRVE